MKMQSCVRVLILALVLATWPAVSALATPVTDPSINFMAGGNNPIVINTVGPLPAVMLNNNGVGSQAYQNKTGETFTDFAFRTDVA